MCPPLERPRFFSGKLLTSEDLASEQQYLLDRLRRHNRSLHGFGIVEGLKVTTASGNIVIGPGLALDCTGNELVLEEALTVTTPVLQETVAYVNLEFTEAHWPPGLQEAMYLKEAVEVMVTGENCNQGHRHFRARWLSCGKAHPFTIARLKPGSRGWRVDSRYRAPMVK